MQADDSVSALFKSVVLYISSTPLVVVHLGSVSLLTPGKDNLIIYICQAEHFH